MSELRLKSTGTLKLFENDNTSSVTIASPASLGADRTITLPDADVTLVSGTMSTGFAVADITGQTALGATPADTDEFVLSDAGVLKRVDYSYLKGGDNTPRFAAKVGTSQTISTSSWTDFTTFDSELYDSDSAYDGATFTVPAGEGGEYFIWIDLIWASLNDNTRGEVEIRVNGSSVVGSRGWGTGSSNSTATSCMWSQTLAATNTLTFRGYQTSGGDATISSGSVGAFKLI